MGTLVGTDLEEQLWGGGLCSATDPHPREAVVMVGEGPRADGSVEAEVAADSVSDQVTPGLGLEQPRLRREEAGCVVGQLPPRLQAGLSWLSSGGFG